MTSKPKAKDRRDAAVIAAEAAVSEKAAELVVARERVRQLEQEYATANEALQQARIAADSHLPRCRLVRINSRSGEEREIGPGVILRKTPGGLLIVRRVGAPSGEIKFKRSEYTGRYTDASKKSGFVYDRLGLRDVPPEFMSGATDGNVKA